MLFTLVLVLMLIGAAAGTSGADLSALQGDNGKHQESGGFGKHLRHVPGKLIVKLKPGGSADRLDGFSRKHKGSVSEKKLHKPSHPKFRDLYVVSVPNEADLDALAAELRTDDAVEYAEPMAVYRAQLTPNDPLYSQQWSHKNTQAESGWNVTTGNSSIVIAVIDTGVVWSHPDLAPNIWSDGAGNRGRDFVDIDLSSYISVGYQPIAGEDYVGVDNDPSDYYGHGTHVAGIVAAAGNNGVGVTGVCPGCRIMAVRAGFAMRQSGYDYGFFQIDNIADAIVYAADSGARIINMSFGGGPSQLMQDAIDYAYANGVVLVAAAGNSGTATTDSAYPAAYPNVIAVSSTGKTDARAYYSNYGSWVAVAAPGGEGADAILSTVPTTGSISSSAGYAAMSGTSMASPYIAGVSGLILSRNPTLNNRQVRQVLREGVDIFNVDLPDSPTYLGTGRINVNKALMINSASAATAAITSPGAEFFAGADLAIIGSSSAPYSVSIGQGNYPGSWTQFAAGQATTGVLGNLDADGVLGASFDQYTIKVAAQDQYGKVDSIVQGRIGTRFLPGFPKQYSSLESPWGIIGFPTLADVDGDGFDEIIIAGRDSAGRGTMTVLKKDGSVAAGYWPQSVNNANGSAFPYGPVAGDLHGDGNMEIVAAVAGYYGAPLICWDRLGNVLWSKVLEPENQAMNISLADVNGDGKLEIITRTNNSTLYLLDAGGNVLWSHRYLNEEDSAEGARNVAVADFDGDGKGEIAANATTNLDPGNTGYDTRTYGGSLTLFNSDGSIRWRHEWPEPGETLTPYYDIHPAASPLIADLNNDGKLEVVARVRVWKADGSGVREARTRFYVFDEKGGVLPGWPLTVEGYPSNSDMALGDLDQDGYPEIVAGTAAVPMDSYPEVALEVSGNLHVVTHSGNLLFPSIPYPANSTPTIADVTGDGRPDIIFYDGTSFRILQRDGSVSTLPVKVRDLYSNVYNTAVVTDLDKNGTEDLVYLEWKPPGMVWAWDLRVPHVAAAEHFTRPGFDARHSNYYVPPAVAPGTLPLGWSSADVGSVGVAGRASYQNGAFLVQGSGANISGTVDGFRYVYKRLDGDGEIVARVSSVQNTNGYAKGGVMIRESLAPDSRHATVDIMPLYGAEFSRRLTAAGSTTVNATAGIASPYWVKLVRRGNSFSGYIAKDGVNWTMLGASTISMASSVYIGLVANSHNNTLLCSASLDSVSQTSVTLPPTATITAPANGAAYLAPATVAITASATPGTGAGVGKVDFYAGSTLIGTSTAAPYRVTWSNVAAGSYALTAKVTDSKGGSATSAAVAVTVGSVVPAPWTTRDIGSVGVAGSAGFLNGAFTLKGSGANIYGMADGFRFVFQPVTGSVQIVARVVSVQNTSSYAKAGVMIRQSLASNAAHAMIDITPGAGAEFLRRTVAGGSTTASATAGIRAPYWVKLVRRGSVFTASISADGINWVQVGSSTISMTGTVYLGLVVNSRNNAALCTATLDQVSVTQIDTTAPTVTAFSVPPSHWSLTVPITTLAATDNVGVTGYLVTPTSVRPSASATGWSVSAPGSYTFTTAGAKSLYAWAKDAAGNVSAARYATVTVSLSNLPAPWMTRDVGGVGVIGSASYANGSFIVKGSGADIWGSADGFRFVYKVMSGDGEIVARVASFQYANSYAKGGVMMRQSLAGNSMHAMMDLKRTGGAEFVRRTVTGGTTSATARIGIGPPYWVKLVRTGNTFTGYVSADGVAWSQVGTSTIAMTSSIYVGLVVNSHNNSALCTTTVDNVR
jgi:subtilisin family serine protease/regulation of enolase protein 1 (concanavalin A-like superfamily)